MTNELLPEGRTEAFPVAWGITRSKDEKPGAYVEFRMSGYGDAKLTWFGHLFGKTAESTIKCRSITTKALVTCGFTSMDLDDLLGESALDSDTAVSVVIAHEDDNNGNTRARIKWINKPSSFGVSAEEAVTLLKGLDLRADFLQAQQEQGVKPKKRGAAIQNPVDFSVSAEELPF